MGELLYAAKVTHVPSMYLSEFPGPNQGSRQDAIDGHKEISKRCRALGVDTIIVFDVHWLVNSGYHLTCCEHFEGIYSSNELPHFIKDMHYEYAGNPALGELIAECANAKGVGTRAHQVQSLGLEYGTLVPMRYMNEDKHFKVVSVAAWCAWHKLDDSRLFGEAVLEAIKKSDSKVAVLASGSLSHRFNDNTDAGDRIFEISDEFFRQVDLRVLELWQHGDFKTFIDMFEEYAVRCEGEGGMHDTAMLLGMLGWDKYNEKVKILSDYFPSSGTGQVNAEFPLPKN